MKWIMTSEAFAIGDCKLIVLRAIVVNRKLSA